MGTALTERQATLLQRFAGASSWRWTPTRPAAPPTCARSRSSPRRAAAPPDSLAGVGTRRAERRARHPRAGAAAGQRPGRADPRRRRGLARGRRAARPVVDHLLAVVSAELDLVAAARPLGRWSTRSLPVDRRDRRPGAAGALLAAPQPAARVSEDALRRQLPRRTRSRDADETTHAQTASSDRDA